MVGSCIDEDIEDLQNRMTALEVRYEEAVGPEGPQGPQGDPGVDGEVTLDMLESNGTELIEYNGVSLFNILGVHYAELPGEVGAINLQFPSTDLRRYGPRPGDGINHEGVNSYMNNAFRNLVLFGKLRIPREGVNTLYKTGWNLRNQYGWDLNGACIEIDDGVEIGGTMHIISSPSPVARKEPTAISVGLPTTVTVAAGHGMGIGASHARYVNFTGTDMLALDGQYVMATAISATQFTVDADTTGQVWSGVGEFSDAQLQNLNIRGNLINYDRIGGICAKNITFDNFTMRSDPDKSTTGENNRGVHVYFGCDDWCGQEIVVKSLGSQVENPTTHAGVAIDGNTLEPKNFSCQRIQVEECDSSAVVLKGYGFDIGQIVVNAFGAGTVTVSPEGINASDTDPAGYTAGTQGAAVWMIRGSGRIGSIYVAQENGYADRLCADHAIIVEGDALDWTSASAFTHSKKGWQIGHINSNNLRGTTLLIGGFGEYANVTVGRIDLGDISPNNTLVTNGGLQAIAGHVWVVHGDFDCETINAGDVLDTQAFRCDAQADASVNVGKIKVGSHTKTCIWHRGHGTVGIELDDREGTEDEYSVRVDGSTTQAANISYIFARNPSESTGPCLLFAPVEGDLGRYYIEDYIGTALAGGSAVRIGNNNANRITANQGGQIKNTNAQAGTGLILDGTGDSGIMQCRITGFTIGVNDAGANVRLAAIGCVATSNGTNTELPIAQALADIAGTNTTFLVP